MAEYGCCTDKECNEKTCMNLPDGKTCGDCIKYEKCRNFTGHKETDTYCDFFPRIFLDKNSVVTKD